MAVNDDSIMTKGQVISTIQNTINDNVEGGITGSSLQGVLLDMVEYSEDAIGLNIVNGEGDNSIKMTTYSTDNPNSAFSKNTTSLGIGNSVGLKGWYFTHAIDNGEDKLDIYLSKTQPNSIERSNPPTTSEDIESGYTTKDKLSIITTNNNIYKSLTIENVDKNKITVTKNSVEDSTDSYVFTGDMTNSWDFTVFSEDNIDDDTLPVDIGVCSVGIGIDNKSIGINTIALGYKTEATGIFSQAMGYNTVAHNIGELAVGKYNESNDNTIFSVGIGNNDNRKNALEVTPEKTIIDTLEVTNKLTASGGIDTTDITADSIIINNTNIYDSIIIKPSSGSGSGYQDNRSGNNASGNNSLAIGNATKATNAYAFASGNNTKADGVGSHTEGGQTRAAGNYTHAEGWKTTAMGGNSHIEGFSSYTLPTTITNSTANNDIITAWASTKFSLAKGENSHVEGKDNLALGNGSHVEGGQTRAAGGYAHAEGWGTQASGSNSHAEGVNAIASGDNSHAEGSETLAYGNSAHAEGYHTLAGGMNSHAEGVNTIASGDNSHAEGNYTYANGINSHTEGNYAYANGMNSHAEGNYTVASGMNSHTQGYYTKAQNENEVALGRYNSSSLKYVDGSQNIDDFKSTLFSIGIGDADNTRKNALEVKQNGNIYIKFQQLTGKEGVGDEDILGNDVEGKYGLLKGVNNINYYYDESDVGEEQQNLPVYDIPLHILFNWLIARIDTNSEKIINITYSELVALKGNYIPGQQYRITDYVTTTVQINTQSAGHQFDIIVTADDESTLNEKARAIQHEGDEYFANSNLAAWEIWYCLDNDTERFAWADIENGKGVIYRMIDEFNNDIPYDFKNIIYVFIPTFECTMFGVSHTYTKNSDIITIGGVNYYSYTRTLTGIGPLPPTTPLYVTQTTLSTSMTLYTIESGVASPYTAASIESVVSKDGVTYTFGGTSDLSVLSSTYSNTISPYYVQSIHTLNRNTFGNNCHNNSFGNNCYNNSFENTCYDNSFVSNCYSNSFGSTCHNNSFGNGCHSNSFGADCASNSFGYSCSGNSFGISCYNNTFGNSCSSISFGYSCSNNSFGISCYNNTFGNSCRGNSFSNSCYYNSFGDNCNDNSFGNSCGRNFFGITCRNNTFGDNCYSNSFGNECQYNSFGNDCINNSYGDNCQSNSFGNSCEGNSFRMTESVDGDLKAFCRYNHFDDGCSNNIVWNAETSSKNAQLQNINVNRGVSGTYSAYNSINITTLNSTYEVQVSKNSLNEIKIFCLADIIA